MDFEHYRRLMRDQARAQSELPPEEYVEIGGPHLVRAAWRALLWGVMLLAVAGVFTLLFYHFTNNLRIALVVVSAMLLYMFVAAKLAEGRFDRRNGE